MVKAVCIVGNKRSGSTQLMNLLNLHPNIFISNESDIMWILYRFHHDLEIIPYQWDTPVGMNQTLKQCRHLLSKEKTPFENFVTIQKTLMEEGFLKTKPTRKDNLLWIGDQKPFQQIDPEIVPFIKQHFPGFKFLHLIRHPFPVIQSSKVFEAGVLWKGMNQQQILERWTMHEKWVEIEKKKGEIPMLDVKYEDIVEHTEDTMTKMFNFLEVDCDKKVLQAARKSTIRLLKWHPRLECSPETLAIMSQYGYQPKNVLLESSAYISFANFLRKTKRKITGTW